MGSTSYPKTHGRTTDQALRTYLADNLPAGHRVVAQATRWAGGGDWSRELFAAVEDGDGNVTCHVLLGASRAGWVIIKSLHEDLGPNGHPDPPARVLAALTPTSNDNAEYFRACAADALERKKAAQDVVG